MKIGDKITVNGTITSIDASGYIHFESKGIYHVSSSRADITITPREIQVGDIVRCIAGSGRFEVVAIRGKEAAIENGVRMFVANLDSLKHYEDA